MARMGEKSFPWDSNGGDREYTAEDFARYYEQFISSGLFMNDGENLQVVAKEGMVVAVKPGGAIIDGYRYENTEEAEITLTAPDGTRARVDRIVVSWNAEEREIALELRTGEAGGGAPEIRRTDTVKDYALADITVAAGAVEVTQSDITDKRMDSEVCGVAVPFATIDTHALSMQYEAWVKEATASGDAAALALLREMRGILDGEAAGNLQNNIDYEALRRKGFEGGVTVFNADGSITTKDEDGGITRTAFGETITTTYETPEGVAVARSETAFNADGSIITTATRY